ncbi:MAG: AraC family ligand binding domain-containing protein [Balneolaceae bacterium]|nr:AraC family ligand binding domain-containing protein [Balneolaceae bacterium]
MTDPQSIYFKLPKTGKEGFFTQYDDQPHFYDQLHHHPELQLMYVINGTGDLYIGDSITSFTAGDLFLIGSNQNHLFKSDSKYYTDNCFEKSTSISVFFHDQSLGKDFFEISEMSTIRHLIERANRGCVFSRR